MTAVAEANPGKFPILGKNLRRFSKGWKEPDTDRSALILSRDVFIVCPRIVGCCRGYGSTSRTLYLRISPDIPLVIVVTVRSLSAVITSLALL